jgi:hypothetical protein
MEIGVKPFQPHPRTWLGILGLLIVLSNPFVQRLLISWFISTFNFQWIGMKVWEKFWIAIILVI